MSVSTMAETTDGKPAVETFKQPLSYGPPLKTDDQWYFTQSQLDHPASCTPPSGSSKQQPIPLMQERLARMNAIKRIWELKQTQVCPMVVVSTAAILVHRFYMFRHVEIFRPADVAAAALFLACKVEEKITPLKYIIAHSLAIESNTEAPLDARGRPKIDESDNETSLMRRRILFTEDAMLHTLCFDLIVQSPFLALVRGCQKVWKVSPTKRQEVSYAAWIMMQDTLATVLPIKYRANRLAAGVVICAVAQLGQPLPWNTGEGVKEEAQKGGNGKKGENGEDIKMGESKVEDLAEEGEEVEVDEDFFETFGVTLEEVRETVLDIVDTYELARDPFVVKEGRRLNKLARRLLDLPAVAELESLPLPAPLELPQEEPRPKSIGHRTPNPYQAPPSSAPARPTYGAVMKSPHSSNAGTPRSLNRRDVPSLPINLPPHAPPPGLGVPQVPNHRSVTQAPSYGAHRPQNDYSDLVPPPGPSDVRPPPVPTGDRYAPDATIRRQDDWHQNRAWARGRGGGGYGGYNNNQRGGFGDHRNGYDRPPSFGHRPNQKMGPAPPQASGTAWLVPATGPALPPGLSGAPPQPPHPQQPPHQQSYPAQQHTNHPLPIPHPNYPPIAQEVNQSQDGYTQEHYGDGRAWSAVVGSGFSQPQQHQQQHHP